jgi:putative acetyltransferase
VINVLLRQATRTDIPAMHRIRMSVAENRLESTVIAESDYVSAIEPPGRGWRVRLERADDIHAIRAVNLEAFETSLEADLVDALRERAKLILSLVADEDGAIVGHILFSPVSLPGGAETRIVGLAPMAVLQARQRQGIGSALVREGLERCREMGYDAVVVLGHPAYYPRFGFLPASRFGIGCEYDVPDEVFMALELVPGALRGKSGTIRYHPAFADGGPG